LLRLFFTQFQVLWQANSLRFGTSNLSCVKARICHLGFIYISPIM